MKKIKYLILIFVMLFIANNNVYAGDLSIWASASNVQVGSTVTISIKAGSLFGTFNIISSDSSILSGPTSGDLDDDTGTYTFTAKKEGTVTITVSPIDMSDYDTEQYYKTSKSVTLNVVQKKTSPSGNNSSSGGTVADKKEYSSDNTLSSLSIEGYSLSPGFQKDVTEYTLKVDESVEKINVIAKATNDKANISGIGEVNLSSGANTIEIKVTAENGNEKIYKLIVMVEDQNPISVKVGKKSYTVVKKNNNLIDLLEYYEEAVITIDGQEVVAYTNPKTKVTLVLLKDGDNKIAYYVYNEQNDTYTKYRYITVQGVTLQLLDATSSLKHYTKYTLKLQDQTIDYYKIKASHKVGLIYGTNVKTGNTDYYVYDQNEETLSKYYDEEVHVYQQEIKKMKNYIMIGTGIIAFVIIAIIIVSLANSKRKRKGSLRK